MTDWRKGSMSPPGRAEDADPSAAHDGELADAAGALVVCRTADEVYDVVSDSLSLLCPGAAIVVNEVTPDMAWLVTRRVVGIGGSLLKQASRVFGVDMVGSRWPMTPAYEAEVRGRELTRLPGGIVDLVSREAPRAVASVSSMMFRVDAVYSIGITDGTNTLGNIRILTRKPDAVLPRPTIEALVRHCWSALAGIASARDLAEREEVHGTVLRTAMDGFWLADAEGRLLQVNEAYCRMSGYAEQELLTMRIPDLQDAQGAADVAARMSGIAAAGEDRFECRHRRKDGSVFDVEASVRYSPLGGGRFVFFMRELPEGT